MDIIYLLRKGLHLINYVNVINEQNIGTNTIITKNIYSLKISIFMKTIVFFFQISEQKLSMMVICK